MVLNNLTETHTFTNGNGPGDEMDGKNFSVQMAPGSFAEYLDSNISPGNHSFYSENNPAQLDGRIGNNAINLTPFFNL